MSPAARDSATSTERLLRWAGILAQRLTFVPWHLHPSFQPQTAARLFQRQAGGVQLVPAEGFREVGGVLGRQATRGRQAGGTLWVAHHLAL